MSSLEQLQVAFLAFLQGKQQDFLELVAEQQPLSRESRASIYRNAYTARLREALDTNHEILGIYLGDEGFELLVTDYINAYPSEVSSLRHFGQHLVRFLSQHQIFSQHPVLAELAGFELLLLDAFDAAESECLEAAALAQVAANAWPGMKVRFHPSVQLFTQAYPAIQSWQALKQQQTPPDALALEQEEKWLLWRSRERLTEFRALSYAEYQAIRTLLQGGDFAQLCEALLPHMPPEQVPQQAVGYLSSWLEQGLISRLVT